MTIRKDITVTDVESQLPPSIATTTRRNSNGGGDINGIIDHAPEVASVAVAVAVAVAIPAVPIDGEVVTYSRTVSCHRFPDKSVFTCRWGSFSSPAYLCCVVFLIVWTGVWYAILIMGTISTGVVPIIHLIVGSFGPLSLFFCFFVLPVTRTVMTITPEFVTKGCTSPYKSCCGGCCCFQPSHILLLDDPNYHGVMLRSETDSDGDRKYYVRINNGDDDNSKSVVYSCTKEEEAKFVLDEIRRVVSTRTTPARTRRSPYNSSTTSWIAPKIWHWTAMFYFRMSWQDRRYWILSLVPARFLGHRRWWEWDCCHTTLDIQDYRLLFYIGFVRMIFIYAIISIFC